MRYIITHRGYLFAESSILPVDRAFLEDDIANRLR